MSSATACSSSCSRVRPTARAWPRSSIPTRRTPWPSRPSAKTCRSKPSSGSSTSQGALASGGGAVRGVCRSSRRLALAGGGSPAHEALCRLAPETDFVKCVSERPIWGRERTGRFWLPLCRWPQFCSRLHLCRSDSATEHLKRDVH